MMDKISYLFILAILPGVLSSCLKAQEQTKQYDHAAVVTAHPEASKVGLSILRQGGNAIDAAVAVQFALAVVYPNAGNIGGGGFLVYRDNRGRYDALDYREKAPQKASRDMYLDENGNPITEKSQYGGLASGVPGTVDGMLKAHQKYGKLDWKKLLQPAIDLAANGFPLTEMQARELNYNRIAFLQYNKAPTAFVGTESWKTGDRLKQSELAVTLSLIRDKKRSGFYEGRVAEAILKTMKESQGIISAQDLNTYQSVWRKVVSGSYNGYKVVSMPPPSSGGIALLTLLKQMEHFPLKRWGFQQDSTVQLMVEAERRAYADRATYLGDPDFIRVPQAGLLDSRYLEKRISDIDFSKATPSMAVRHGAVSSPETEQTTHFSIVDQYRNAVSVTTTLNGSYGSFVVVAGAGFILNNEMDDFSIKPGMPNMYGLVGGVANEISPGKRMLSSMTPTIVEKDGKLLMVVGTPGGSTIITSVFQTILNVLVFNQDMQTAVTAPRFHHQWLPDEVYMESGAISPEVRNRLTAKGYKLVTRASIGRVDAILVKPDGKLETGADPRGDDRAEGY